MAASKGKPCVRPIPINYIRFLPLFKENRRKIVSRPNGREAGKMYAYAFSLCEAVKRFRMAAS